MQSSNSRNEALTDQEDASTDHCSISTASIQNVYRDSLEASSEHSFSTATQISDTSVDNELPENPSVHTSATVIPIALSKTPSWLPYTLRWIPLSLTLGISLSLTLAVIVVHVVSSQNSGLVDDSGSRIIVIGSKFVPTLLAVAYNLLLMILLDDIKRTEPYARLASPSGATAKLSLTWTADTWWHTLYRSFPSPLGRAKWALPFATVVFILGSLAVSPLSSTLFISHNVVFNQSTSFLGLNLDSSLPLQPAPLPTTYFRTISNILQNVSTSAWITDEYVVFPFWPSRLSNVPLSPILSNGTEVWTNYATTIFSLDLECESMAFKWKSPPPPSVDEVTDLSLTLASHTGCTLDLYLGNSLNFATSGGEVWSKIDSISKLLLAQYNTFPLGKGKVHGCDKNEILVSSTHGIFDDYGPRKANFSVAGQACQANYYTGHSTATVTLRQGQQSLVEVNKAEYEASKVPISAMLANTAAFDKVFFNSNWTIHIDANHLGTDPQDFAHFSVGPANLLAPLYQYSPEEIIADHSIGSELERIRRRFFAELIHNAFEIMAMEDPVQVPGSVLTTSRRIVVSPAVAIALEVIISIQAIMLATILYLTRPSRRPLGLTGDPAPVLSIARLISYDPSTLTALTKCSNGTINNLEEPLDKFNFKLVEGQIKTNTVRTPSEEETEQTNNKSRADISTNGKIPSFIPFWVIALLLIVLGLTLATVATLYHYSKFHGLYQTVFVYSIDVTFNNRSFGQVNPASLITTLVAVIISLWWGSFDVTLRRVQPYLALAGAPVLGYKGVAVSYRSSYLLWAAYRATRRRHWVLFLVSTGTFLAEVLTIAMSSLWNRAPGALSDMVPVSRALELRTVPMVSAAELSAYPEAGFTESSVLTEIFKNLKTSWIYGATTQLTLQGPEPSWSLDDWSFIPSNLSVASQKHLQNTGGDTSDLDSTLNVTMVTPATRARLECSPYEHLDDWSLWLRKLDVDYQKNLFHTAKPKHLKSGYELGVDQLGRMYLDQAQHHKNTTKSPPRRYTSIESYAGRLQCCENTTGNSVGQASVGYWTRNKGLPDTWPNNFTVKWIHGKPIERIKSKYAHKQLIWTEPPQLTALNCQPVIEYANAQVTVDAGSGQVISYHILEAPRADEHAWSSPFLQYRNDPKPENPDYYEANFTVSHGILFVTGLLEAAEIRSLVPEPIYEAADEPEHVEDQTFALRGPGLNIDYMTYAMLSMVDFDHQQLLDIEMLKHTAQRTFSTMYQYFVNNDLNLTKGGRVYQPVNEKLPNDIGRPFTPSKRTINATAADSQDVMLHISRPVEMLYISEPAAWISMIILGYLILSCGVLAVVSRRYNRMLPGPTNTIADTAALIAGSPRLLELARYCSTEGMKGDKSTRAKLGWFTGSQGEKRWGIELVNADEEVC